MKLNELRDNPGATKNRIRVGRGIGSGKGKTSGKGVKGQKARTGVAIKGFEGGQMPLYRRLPKRGFNNSSSVEFSVVNLGQIQAAIDAGKLDVKNTVDAAALKKAGLISKTNQGVRVLGKGDLKTKITLELAGASQKAADAIEKAGGKLTSLVQKREKGPRKPEKRATATKQTRREKKAASKKSA